MQHVFEGNLLEGVFSKRLNRFLAEIFVEDKIVLTHVPNTGRMKELLVEGARIIVRKVNNPDRKTQYDLLMVYHGEVLVAIDSKLPNQLIYKGFSERKIPNFSAYEDVRKEVVFGKSRLDIGLLGKNTKALIEVKCVTFVDNGIAKFPDAPTERGTKHVKELIVATKNGIEAGIIFVIQRNDANIFTPNLSMDPDFSKALEEANQEGVKIAAYNCEVRKDRIEVANEIKVSFECWN